MRILFGLLCGLVSLGLSRPVQSRAARSSVLQTQVQEAKGQLLRLYILNSRDGKPVSHAQVDLGFFDQSGQPTLDNVTLPETDSNGMTQGVVTHLAGSLGWNIYYRGKCCLIDAIYPPSLHSQLRLPGPLITEIVSRGVVRENRSSGYRASAKPGELVIFARPYTWRDEIVAAFTS